MIRSIRYTKTSLIGDILAKRQATIGMCIAKDDNAVKLSHKFICKNLEGLCIFGCPPFLEVAVFVKLASLVVKSMSHFVAYHDADSAIVDGIVSLRVKERSLKYSGREADLIA